MKGKAKTYFLCGLIMIAAGVLALFSASGHSTGLAVISLGCAMLGMYAREKKKADGDDGQRKK